MVHAVEKGTTANTTQKYNENERRHAEEGRKRREVEGEGRKKVDM
jgi:hypothetical protein